MLGLECGGNHIVKPTVDRGAATPTVKSHGLAARRAQGIGKIVRGDGRRRSGTSGEQHHRQDYRQKYYYFFHRPSSTSSLGSVFPAGTLAELQPHW